MAAQATAIVRALWAAAFRLEEQVRLYRVLADATEIQSRPISATDFRSTAMTSRAASVVILKLLSWATSAGTPGPDNSGHP